MKGYALQILWPNHVTVRDLFSLITPPNEGFVGAYVRFLTRTLPGTLAAGDLPVALGWATSFVAEVTDLVDFHRRSLADSIFVQAWRNLVEPGIIDPLLNYVFARLRRHHILFGGTGLRESETFLADLESDLARRRRFLLTAAHRALSRVDAYHLMRVRLLQRTDLEWLLSFCPGAPAYDSKLDPDALCSMVGTIAFLHDADDFKAVYDAALNWPALWQSFKGVFERVPLASEDARQLRSTHEMMKSYQERKPPPVTPPPAQRIAELLDLFDAGDWAAWWRLNRELTLTPMSTHYASDWDYSISKMPGWQDADASTRQRILSAARKYLDLGETSISEWIGTNTLRLNDLAAFRAMLLLRDFNESEYREIPPETWAKWAPAVAAVPKSTGSEKAKFQTEVVADALAAAPAEFVAAVREIMRRERARAAETAADQPQPPGASFFILRELEGCWGSDALKAGIFAELEDDSNSEDQFASILDALLTAQFVPARELAIAHLTGELPQERRHAVAAVRARRPIKRGRRG